MRSRADLLPVVAFLGPAIADIITGSFVVETIFQVPGLGRFFVTAAFNRDYTMVLGTVLFYAVLIILAQPRRGHRSSMAEPEITV